MIFEVDNTTKQLIDELQSSIKQTISELKNGQADIKRTLDRINGSFASAEQMEAEIAKLNELSEKLDSLGSLLAARFESLSSLANAACSAANTNTAYLAAITAYLSRPGYKRFFKGMEAVTIEATE